MLVVTLYNAQKYSIIDVPLENGETVVTVVPHKWIYNGEVLCPEDANKEASLSKSYADPDESFKLRKCTVRKTYDSFEAARIKLPFAYDTDGLVSDKELGRGSRKKKATQPFSFEDEKYEDQTSSKSKKSKQISQQSRKTSLLNKPLPAPPKTTTQSKVGGFINALHSLKNKNPKKKITTAISSSSTSKVCKSTFKSHVQIQEDSNIAEKLQRIKELTSINMLQDPPSFAKRNMQIQCASGQAALISLSSNDKNIKKGQEGTGIQSQGGTVDLNESDDDDYVQNLPKGGTVDLNESDDDDYVQNLPKGGASPSVTGSSSSESDEESRRVILSEQISPAVPQRKSQHTPLKSQDDPCSSQNILSSGEDPRKGGVSQTRQVQPQGKTPQSKEKAPHSKCGSGSPGGKFRDEEEQHQSRIRSNRLPLNSIDPSILYQRLLVKQQLTLTKMVEVEHKLDLVLGHVGSADGSIKPEGWPASFPLSSMLSLLEFESALKEPETFEFAVRHFSVVVGMGSDPAGMAGDICAKLFTKELASKLNWLGTDLKRGIKKMGIGKIIVDAVAKRYEGKFKNSTVTTAISVWLRNRA